MESSSFFQRLKQGLAKSREGFAQRIGAVFQGRQWDAETLEEVEENLLAADVGIHATQRIVDRLRRQSPTGSQDIGEAMRLTLQQSITEILEAPQEKPTAPPLSRSPWVIVFLGVNGVGKTTSIGKMAAQLRRADKKVLMVAADTFRAAAIEQLEAWGHKAGADVVRHRSGSDPSAVVFDGLQAAKTRGVDVVLIDTAGRLHTKSHLVEELKKLRRVIGRELAGAPHETLLVLDATTGQNGLQQARVFKEAIDVTGIVLTKLDGTAKGGVIISIQETLGIPVQYIGVGEEVDDLQPFDPSRFVQALFEQ